MILTSSVANVYVITSIISVLLAIILCILSLKKAKDEGGILCFFWISLFVFVFPLANLVMFMWDETFYEEKYNIIEMADEYDAKEKIKYLPYDQKEYKVLHHRKWLWGEDWELTKYIHREGENYDRFRIDTSTDAE